MKCLELVKNYFSNRSQEVEIGVSKGSKRKSERGVLQGSGLSPVFFLIYFLRAGVANRVCRECKNEMKKMPKDRNDECNECGTSVVYADDLNVVTKVMDFNRTHIEETRCDQGSGISRLCV